MTSLSSPSAATLLAADPLTPTIAAATVALASHNCCTLLRQLLCSLSTSPAIGQPSAIAVSGSPSTPSLPCCLPPLSFSSSIVAAATPAGHTSTAAASSSSLLRQCNGNRGPFAPSAEARRSYSEQVSIVLQSTTAASSCLHQSSLSRTPFPLFQLSPGSIGRGDFLPPPSTQIYDRSATWLDRTTPPRSAMRGSRQSPVNCRRLLWLPFLLFVAIASLTDALQSVADFFCDRSTSLMVLSPLPRVTLPPF
ncbi:hypothetical protein BHE74_00048094 [Ensete ventricosum]|nr:hypothetical protein BHE74_00048094 [Ensete ventricosum]